MNTNIRAASVRTAHTTALIVTVSVALAWSAPRPVLAQLPGSLVVSMTAPTSGSTVTGTTPVSASISVVGSATVVGVQFMLDGANLGPEDLSAPYSMPWNTIATSNGPHTLTATARDALGIRYNSNPVTVTVSNTMPTATRFENTDPSIAYTPGTPAAGRPPDWWHGSRSRGWSGVTSSFNRSAGARATFSFTGTEVRWIGFRAFWAGLARVYLDGALVADLDLFLPACTPQERTQGCIDEQTQVPVFRAAGLSNGSHTLTVEATGQKHGSDSCDAQLDPKNCAADYAVVVDAFDVAPSAMPPVTGMRVDETSAGYTAGWSQGNTGQAWSGGTAAISATAGARAAFTFIGTEMSWIGLRGPQTGIARVHLDGVFQAEVDTFSSTEVQAAVFTLTGLAPASHTVQIEVTGGRNANATDSLVVVDGFDTRSRVEDPDPAIAYVGPTWQKDETRWAFSGTSANTGAGTAALSATAGAQASFAFTGTGVTWIGFRGPWAGIAEIFIDGGLAARLDLYAGAEGIRAPIFAASNLSTGTHTLRIDVTGQKHPAATAAFVVVDAFDVTLPASAPPVTRIQEVDASVAYTAGPAGGWTGSSPDDLFSGRTVASAVASGARATFTFTGTGVRWIGQHRRDAGIARVSLDGGPPIDIDMFAALQDEYQATVFHVTGLANTAHTLTIEVTGQKNSASTGTLVVVDAFDIH